MEELPGCPDTDNLFLPQGSLKHCGFCLKCAANFWLPLSHFLCYAWEGW